LGKKKPLERERFSPTCRKGVHSLAKTQGKKRKENRETWGKFERALFVKGKDIFEEVCKHEPGGIGRGGEATDPSFSVSRGGIREKNGRSGGKGGSWCIGFSREKGDLVRARSSFPLFTKNGGLEKKTRYEEATRDRYSRHKN